MHVCRYFVYHVLCISVQYLEAVGVGLLSCLVFGVCSLAFCSSSSGWCSSGGFCCCVAPGRQPKCTCVALGRCAKGAALRVCFRFSRERNVAVFVAASVRSRASSCCLVFSALYFARGFRRRRCRGLFCVFTAGGVLGKAFHTNRVILGRAQIQRSRGTASPCSSHNSTVGWCRLSGVRQVSLDVTSGQRDCPPLLVKRLL